MAVPRFFVSNKTRYIYLYLLDFLTLSNVKTPEEIESSSFSLAANAFPKAIHSTTGVSVEYTPTPGKKWFVFRASYGREDIASDFLIADGTYVYIPKCYKIYRIAGKNKKVLKSILPNLLFVYSTQKQANEYIKQTPSLSFLSYYYDHTSSDKRGNNSPLTIPIRDMENFVMATCSKSEHIRLLSQSIQSYKKGDMVKVTDGAFAGVTGYVRHIMGQQRVVIEITGICTIATAYIPSAFLEKISL